MRQAGSATKEGYLYHEPAFLPSLPEGVRYHRNDNVARYKVIAELMDWNHKGVLEIGCNVGFFAIHLAMEGARVVGVDTDERALNIGRMQADSYWIDNVSFTTPTEEMRYVKDKDVLLALSVIPWIYQTDDNAEKTIEKLFTINTAILEIPYPPDGRAHVPGVYDDNSCKQWLKRYYKVVRRLPDTLDETDGVVRNRSMWFCTNNKPRPELIIGSQSFITRQNGVIKKSPRNGHTTSRETQMLGYMMMQQRPKICPLLDKQIGDDLFMEEIHGFPITMATLIPSVFESEMRLFQSELKERGVCHNDIRPLNIIETVDARCFLIDFGHATFTGEERPVSVCGHLTDDEAIEELIRLYPLWQQARDRIYL